MLLWEWMLDEVFLFEIEAFEELFRCRKIGLILQHVYSVEIANIRQRMQVIFQLRKVDQLRQALLLRVLVNLLLSVA